jgi:hypothetical protein
MQTLKNILIVILMAAACFALVEVGLSIREARQLITDTNQKLDGTFRNLNAILIQVGLVAARVEDASRDLREVSAAQKEYWKQISRSTAELMSGANITIANINTLSGSLDNLVKNTDAQINGHLLPATEETLLETKNSLTTISESTRILTADSHVVIEDLHKVLADENWQNALKGISDTTNNAAIASDEIAKAAKELPSIAQSMEKIAKTSSKWQKIQIPISIVSLIWRTFFY